MTKTKMSYQKLLAGWMMLNLANFVADEIKLQYKEQKDKETKDHLASDLFSQPKKPSILPLILIENFGKEMQVLIQPMNFSGKFKALKIFTTKDQFTISKAFIMSTLISRQKTSHVLVFPSVYCNHLPAPMLKEYYL